MAGASLAVARAAFEAQHSSELSVAEGERLWVLAEQPEAARMVMFPGYVGHCNFARQN